MRGSRRLGEPSPKIDRIVMDEPVAKTDGTTPKALLRPCDALALTIGMVVGIGVFRAPSLVALRLDDPVIILALWAGGAAFMLIGLLCYAELASAWPDPGGEYHFLTRAYGPALAYLFAWSRLAVIQTGSIAMAAFVLGDYAQRLLSLGPQGSSIYAALGVLGLTAVNVTGTRITARAQNALAAMLVATAMIAGVLGFAISPDPRAESLPAAAADPASMVSALGFAMIFIMLTYGGWNEASYLSGELKDVKRNMLRVALAASGVIGAIYLLLNAAYLKVLGVSALRASDAVGADYMARLLGSPGAMAISGIIVVAALSTMNATIFTGARSAYALGRDHAPFSLLGRWNARAQGSVNALLVQSVLSLVLIDFGTTTRKGFTTMVDFTAPVFWFFLTMVGIALFKLRQRNGDQGGFRIPFYPLTPALFCLGTAYMLHASLSYNGMGAIFGVAAVAFGLPLWFFFGRRAGGGASS